MKSIMLTGSGGQGMILAGIILARAGVRDGLEATQTQSYGPEARGGASRAEVILDTEPIDFPRVVQADVLLAMTQEACNKFVPRLRPGGTLIVDPLHVREVPKTEGAVHSVEITRVAREEVGRELTANIVALGALNRLCGLVSDDALAAAVRESVPRGTEELNMRALAAGGRTAQSGCNSGGTGVR